MDEGPGAPTRREQRRAETLGEITTLAMRQVEDDGPDAVSLNAIARAMNMSPAAIYRYFDSRDALLTRLVVEAYDSLADALVAAGAAQEDPRERAAAVLRATRTWALAHPHAYRLIFQTHAGSGQDLAPELTIPASQRSMGALLSALSAVSCLASASGADPEPGPTVAPELLAQLRHWAERSGDEQVSPRVVALGLTAWTRLHGVISLELGHHLASTGIDPALLYEAEVAGLVAQAAPSGPGAG